MARGEVAAGPDREDDCSIRFKQGGERGIQVWPLGGEMEEALESGGDPSGTDCMVLVVGGSGMCRKVIRVRVWPNMPGYDGRPSPNTSRVKLEASSGTDITGGCKDLAPQLVGVSAVVDAG